MAATKKPSEPAAAGFTDEQVSTIRQIIEDAVGGAKPPADEPKKGPSVSDDEWGKMTDRQRQSYVTSLVDFRLDELAKLDKDADRERRLTELEGRKAPEPEAAPSVWSKVQAFLWGELDKK